MNQGTGRIGCIARAIAVLSFGLILFPRCDRDNLFDPKANNYLPGTPPEAHFIEDTKSGFIKDSIVIKVRFEDTAAIGGRDPRVTMLYFNWEGDSTVKADSMTAPDDTIAVKVKRFLGQHRKPAFVWAKDNDERFSRPDAMEFAIDEGKPRITSLAAPDTAKEGTPITASVTAKDTNGTIIAYIWRVDKNLLDTTPVNQYKTTLSGSGSHTLIVRAMDDDSICSDPDSVLIRVFGDTKGPDVAFESPTNGSEQKSERITVIVSTIDPGGIGLVMINFSEARRVEGGSDTSSMWRADSVALKAGSNPIVVNAWDKSINKSTASITVTYNPSANDTNAPEIIVATPKTGDIVYQSPCRVVVTVVDHSGLGISKVLCGDTVMSKLSGGDYAADVPLFPGKDTLTVEAVDNKGRHAKKTLIITYNVPAGNDTIAPLVRIVTPLPNQHISEKTCAALVYASDNSGIASVTINGKNAAYCSASQWTGEVSLRHGLNTISATAEDKSVNHNRNRDSVAVVQNSPPRFSPDVSLMDTILTAGIPAVIPVYATDPDGDTLTDTLLYSTDPAVRLEKAAAGGVLLSNYAPGDSGIDTFIVRVSDTYGANDTVTIRAFIHSGQMTKPFFTTTPADIPDTAVAATPYIVKLAAKDPKQKPLSFSLATSPAGAVIDSTGKVSWIPAKSDTGEMAFCAVVCNDSESDTLQWTVIVVALNVAPEFVKPGDTVIGEKQTLRIVLSASDPNGDSLVFTFSSSFPTGAKLEKNVFSWTPSNSDSGIYTIGFKVTEVGTKTPLWDTTSVTIRVVDITKPKFTAHAPVDTAFVGCMLKDTLRADDADGDTLFFSKLAGPSGLLIGRSGVVTWIPQAGEANTLIDVTAIVADNGGLTDTLAWKILTLPAQTIPNWPRVFGDSLSQDTGFAVVQLHGGGYALCGTARLPGGGMRGRCIKTDRNGEVTFSTLYGGQDKQVRLVSLQRDSGDGLILCGTELTAGKEKLLLIKTKAGDTATDWVSTFTCGPPGEFDARGASVRLTRDGGYVACGESIRRVSPKVELRVLLVKVKSDGTSEWEKVYDLPGSLTSMQFSEAAGRCAMQTSDNGYVICGHTSGFNPGKVTNTLVIRARQNGDAEWTKVYNGVDFRAAFSIAQAGDGGFFIGEMLRSGLSGLAGQILKIDATGDIQWPYSIPGGGTSAIISVCATGDGGCIAAGYSTNGTIGGADAVLIKLSSDGKPPWPPKYYGTAGDDAAQDAASASDGGYIFTGFTPDNGAPPNTGMYLVKTKDNGEISPR